MLKGIVVTKDPGLVGRGSSGFTSGQNQLSGGGSLIPEVDDKVFRFSRHTKTPVVGKRTDASEGGRVGGMRTSTEIPQAERSIHETNTVHTELNNQA